MFHKTFLHYLSALLIASWSSTNILAQTASQPRSNPVSLTGAIPTLENLASEWLDVSQITQMPSLHNFHEMAACEPTLLGVNYYPGGQLFGWPVTTRWYDYHSLPQVKLTIDGKVHDSTTCRWYPYQAVRRSSINSLEVETIVRMVFEGPGILYRIRVTNRSAETRRFHLAIEVPGEPANGSNADQVQHVRYNSQDPVLKMAHAFVQKPQKIISGNGAVTAVWKPVLETGDSITLELVMAHTTGEPSDSAEVGQTAENWANEFRQAWADVKARWSQRWFYSFAPNNPHFSGNVPTLVTSDEKIRDIYYRSILTLLVLHRTNLKMCDRVFVTSGERDKGFVFYWDTSMWSKVFAMWEPEGMKQQLRLFLKADPHGGFVYNMETGEQGDGWYAANDMTMFRLVNSYLAVTGDSDFLAETVGDHTVLEHMEKLATGWQALQRDRSVMLADYGENENLLECAPMYVHRVPSFNSANVWMMRIVADLHEQQGNAARAEELREWADQIASAVLDLYKPGDGVWHSLHRDGTKVELRHCYDFVCIGKFMADDLTEQMKIEMVDFVERELLTDKWMRAMSLQDKAAKLSDRPDHGPFGAFDAWPALTVDTMCKLGAWQKAIDFARDTQAVLYEGVYAQAREFYGPKRMEHDAPVRIALRGACMRECVGGGSFAEMIIGSLFGLSLQYGDDLQLFESNTNRDFEGTLVNVPIRGEFFEIKSGPVGVSFRSQR